MRKAYLNIPLQPVPLKPVPMVDLTKEFSFNLFFNGNGAIGTYLKDASPPIK